MNVIPEGALHAHKNHMEGAGKDFTHKGIPVIDDDGKQQAEIEREEVIFNKEVTEKLENYYKQYNDDSKSQSEKDEIAIKAGKLLAKQLMENTEDRTGLIEKVEAKS
jgi:myo-inositol-1-phosphate synthase